MKELDGRREWNEFERAYPSLPSCWNNFCRVFVFVPNAAVQLIMGVGLCFL
jgi:hypothetical protein